MHFPKILYAQTQQFRGRKFTSDLLLRGCIYNPLNTMKISPLRSEDSKSSTIHKTKPNLHSVLCKKCTEKPLPIITSEYDYLQLLLCQYVLSLILDRVGFNRIKPQKQYSHFSELLLKCAAYQLQQKFHNYHMYLLVLMTEMKMHQTRI